MKWDNIAIWLVMTATLAIPVVVCTTVISYWFGFFFIAVLLASHMFFCLQDYRNQKWEGCKDNA